MKIFPGVHYSMGGLWVDDNQMTNIQGLYAIGECDYSIHGANRLGANSLLSCIYAGFIAGPHSLNYAKNLPAAPENLASSFEEEKKRQSAANNRLLSSQGTENPFKLWRELGDIMSRNVTVTRYNDKLQETDVKLLEFLERYGNVNLNDKSMWSNQSFLFTRQLYNMLQLARVITQGAWLRNESRGSHYKPEFPERDDVNFLKTTKAFYAPDTDAPRFEWEAVDVSLIQPRPRRYDSK
jgi:succinate dehydrogenase / fumarate reductase flavoprotein subunit